MSDKKLIITIGIIISVVIVTAIITSNNNETYAINDSLVSVVIKESKGSSWSSGASGVYKLNYKKADGTTIGNDYRYIGANPNNYVKFNNDMYQIIGVFDENTHGHSGKQLVKLIRARVLGSYSWGVHNSSLINGIQHSFSNDWTGTKHTTPSNLNILLNEYFYKKTNNSNIYGSCGDWTYFSFSSSGFNYRINNCERLKIYGIDEKIRNYIQTSTFHLKGYIDRRISKNNLYLCERGLYSGCTSANNGEYDSEIIANIGLLYPSDYMYASGYYSTNDSTNGESYYYANQNWLHKGYEWTITPLNNKDYDVYFIYYSGSLFYDLDSVNGTGNSYNVRPTFYLKEDVYVTGGNGSFDHPYTLDCDTCS